MRTETERTDSACISLCADIDANLTDTPEFQARLEKVYKMIVQYPPSKNLFLINTDCHSPTYSKDFTLSVQRRKKLLAIVHNYTRTRKANAGNTGNTCIPRTIFHRAKADMKTWYEVSAQIRDPQSPLYMASDVIVHPTPMPIGRIPTSKLNNIITRLKENKPPVGEYVCEWGRFDGRPEDVGVIFADLPRIEKASGARLDLCKQELSERTGSSGSSSGARLDLCKQELSESAGARLDLCKQELSERTEISGSDISLILDAMKNNPYIRHFLFGNNASGKSGAIAIANFLKTRNPCDIKTWYLAGNCFDGSCVATICDAFIGASTHCNVRQLWLKRNPVGDDGCDAIARYLSTEHCTLEVLDLYNTGITHKGVETLMQSLTSRSTPSALASLYLGGNGLSKKIVPPLAKWMSSPQCGLQHLFLGVNRIFDEGLEELIALTPVHVLRSFNISSNALSSKCLPSLLKWVDQSPHFNALDLSTFKGTADMSELPNNLHGGGDILASWLLNRHRPTLFKAVKTFLDASECKQMDEAFDANEMVWVYENVQRGVSRDEIHITTVEKNRCAKIFGSECVKDPIAFSLFVRQVMHGSGIGDIDSIYRVK